MIFNLQKFFILVTILVSVGNVFVYATNRLSAKDNKGRSLRTGYVREEILIDSIRIKTENKKLKLLIEKQLADYFGQAFSRQINNKIHDHINSILLKNKILQAKLDNPLLSINEKKVVITYEINHPYQYGFVLINNTIIDNYGLMPPSVYSQLFDNSQWERKLLSHIKELYLKKGYFKVQVDHQLKTDKKNFKKIGYLSIKEGRPIKIKQINISGQFSRPKKYYMRLIRQYSGSLLLKNLFYKEGLDSGITSLIGSLKNEGYLQAYSQSRVQELAGGKVSIDVFINEGPLTKIVKITFKGVTAFSDQQLKYLMQTKANKGLNISQLEADIKAIINLYQDTGFVEMKINNLANIVEYKDKNQRANLLFDLTEGSQVIVGDILIKGNLFTHRETILRNLSMKIGKVLSVKKINSSVKKLRELGLFSFVEILLQESNKEGESRTVVIYVKERKPRSIRLAFGFNSYRSGTARGVLELNHNNIMGTGRQVIATGTVQSSVIRDILQKFQVFQNLEYEATINYVEPFVFNTGFKGVFSVSNASKVFSYDSQIETSTFVNSTEVSFVLESIIRDYINLEWTLMNWEGRNEFMRGSECRASSTDGSVLSDSCKSSDLLNIVTTGVLFSIDKRDNVIATSSGFLSNLLIEYYPPVPFLNTSQFVHFIKVKLKHTNISRLIKGWTLVNSIHSGVIASLSDKNQGSVPVSRSFILGGNNSLRGYDGLINGDRLPSKVNLPISGSNELISVRSSPFFILQTELRFPISANLQGSIFYDGGGVGFFGRQGQNPSFVDSISVGQSFGFGIRYNSFIGAISGYIAFKTHPKENENVWQTHFSFGML